MDRRTHRRTDRQTDDGNLVRNYYTLFSKEKNGYNKGKMFQSSMSKHTVDGNCMTEKMLIVMFSTKPAKGENNHTND